MPDIGDGPIKSIARRHFWKVAILFILIVGSIWAWHRFKIRHDVQAEKNSAPAFQAQQKNAAPSPR